MMPYGFAGVLRTRTASAVSAAHIVARPPPPPPQPTTGTIMPANANPTIRPRIRIRSSTQSSRLGVASVAPVAPARSSDGAPRGKLVEVGGDGLHPPPQPPPSSTVLDPRFQRVPGTLGPSVAAVQRGDVQRHGGEILEQHRTRRQGAHGGVGLEIALAAVADLHLPRRLTFLRRQIPELFVRLLVAERAPQPFPLPARAAAAAPQPALAPQPPELRQRRPRPADRAVAFPPRRRRFPARRVRARL